MLLDRPFSAKVMGDLKAAPRRGVKSAGDLDCDLDSERLNLLSGERCGEKERGRGVGARCLAGGGVRRGDGDRMSEGDREIEKLWWRLLELRRLVDLRRIGDACRLGDLLRLTTPSAGDLLRRTTITAVVVTC